MSKVDIRNIDRIWEDYMTPVVFDDLDIATPKTLPMRLNADNEKHVEIRKDTWDCDHGTEKANKFYKYMNNWVPTLVGKPFDEAYKKLIKTWPERIGRINTREQFKKYLNMDDCEEQKPRRKTKYAWRGGYYVDENGIIRHPGWMKEERKSIIIPKENGIITKWNIKRKELTLDVLDRIYILFGAKWYDIFKNSEYLTEQQHNELMKHSNFHKVVLENNRMSWGYQSGRFGRYNFKELKSISDFITCNQYYVDYDEYFEGTKAYEKYKAEELDKKHKIRREWIKEREEQKKHMLADIVNLNKLNLRKKQEEERKRLMDMQKELNHKFSNCFELSH